MSEHNHTGPTSCCAGDPGPRDAWQAPTDAAGRSLAEALNLSFRLLTLIMIFMVVAFLWTGLKGIKSDELGIVKVFGRKARIAKPGFTYNWPFPIGEIEIVENVKHKFVLDDFWMHETAEDRTKKTLRERGARGEGLRPGWDGALLTGDRFLLHMRIECTYQVSDPAALRQQVRGKYTVKYPGMEAPVEIDPKQEFVRSAICSAAIKGAATLTADGLQTTDRKKFAHNVRRLANATLKAMNTGLEIKEVQLPGATWPKKALAAYEAAQKARANADGLKSAARSKAENTLRHAAGESYIALVGRPWETKPAGQSGNYDLIGKYTATRAAGDEEAAAKVLLQIDEVLVNRVKGKAATIIAEARTYETRVRQRVEAMALEFERLLPEFRRSPKFTIDRLWAETRDAVISGENVEKHYLVMGRGKTILKINRDPEIIRKLTRDEIQQRGE